MTEDESPPPAARDGSPSEGAPRGRGLAWVSLVVLLGALAIGLRSPTPAPRPADADPAEFSAARALEHLAVIAREPHPTSSPADAEVRAFLERELAARGLEVATQRGTWRHRAYGDGEGELVNVLGRRKGVDATGVVALVAHHDSAGFARGGAELSHGAADDGAAVAAMLEVLRALDEGPPLRNDLVVVLTDAEELGLQGARRFQEHPWCEGIDVVFNFEGRGSSGPALMFQTSLSNRWLVEEWAEAVPHPVGSSVMADIYRRMPNDTDFTVFLDHGFAGLNFAFVGGYEAYHTARDTIENLDRGTLQHHGETMLALARRFGNLDLGSPREGGNLVYFNPLGAWLVSYPEAWNGLEAGLVVLLLGAGIVLGVRRRRLGAGELAIACAVQLSAVLLGTAVAYGIARSALWGAGARSGFTPCDPAFFVAIALAVVAVSFALERAVDRRVGAAGRTAAAGLGWLVVLLLSCRFLPGGSYLAFWPALAMGIALGHDVLWRPAPRRAGIVLLALTAAILPCLAATYALFQEGLMLRGAAAPVPLLVLVLGPCWTLLRPLGRRAVLLAPLLGTVAAGGVGVLARLA